MRLSGIHKRSWGLPGSRNACSVTPQPNRVSLEACVGAFEKDKTFLLYVVPVPALCARRLTESFAVEAAQLLSCLLHLGGEGLRFPWQLSRTLGHFERLLSNEMSVELPLGDLAHPPSTRP